jgi:hypothetical protein
VRFADILALRTLKASANLRCRNFCAFKHSSRECKQVRYTTLQSSTPARK